MVEDRRSESPIPNQESFEPDAPVARSGGSLIIFVLVAIALILAIGFFYMTKDSDDDQADSVINAANSNGSAAQLVGGAAKNAADTLRNRN